MEKSSMEIILKLSFHRFIRFFLETLSNHFYPRLRKISFARRKENEGTVILLV